MWYRRHSDVAVGVSMLTVDLLTLAPGTWNRKIILYMYQLEETK